MVKLPKLIAHRGNIIGPMTDHENQPVFIRDTIEAYDFDCEVDLWVLKDRPYFGHDHAHWFVDGDFLEKYSARLWVHAKNLEALEFCIAKKLHCFWHENDKRVLTSEGFIWTYPGKRVGPYSVLVHLEEQMDFTDFKGYAVCGDYIQRWRSLHSV